MSYIDISHSVIYIGGHEMEHHIHQKGSKTGKKLPKSVKATLLLLVRDLEAHGPTPRGIWKNYSKFKGIRSDKRHCHLVKGKPTYVCCWEVVDKTLKIVEVYYVGTHEKAPY